MIVFIFTILRIFTVESVRKYAHLRKSMHISINVTIWVMEISAIVLVHEMALHLAIPTAMMAHESVLLMAED